MEKMERKKSQSRTGRMIESSEMYLGKVENKKINIKKLKRGM
jgi:hypothetical protein